jgi:hypothetical protein
MPKLPQQLRILDENLSGARLGGGAGIKISDWKPFEKNSLRGFFTAALPSGLILHNLMLCASHGVRWVAYPAKEYIDAGGKNQYARFISFSDCQTEHQLRDEILTALDRHLEGEPR